MYLVYVTFGTNGFYLEFKQTGTSANSSGMGADTSGNDNHFGTSGLAATDQSTDTCTNNFVILNNLNVNHDGVITLSEGNLMSRLMVRQETYKVLQLEFLQVNGIGKLKISWLRHHSKNVIVDVYRLSTK